MLIWTDLETTGLDPERDIILEVAVVITNDDLIEAGHYTSIVIDSDPTKFAPRSQESASTTDQFAIYDAHFENGLVKELINAQNDDPVPSLPHVQSQILDFLTEYGILGGQHMSDRPPLCGSTISFDRSFLVEYMPDVMARLHYRNVDVSTVRELAQRWWPDLPGPEKTGAHRALSDIRESIDLLRYYRDKEFICGP